jgi:hypothetical protein
MDKATSEHPASPTTAAALLSRSSAHQSGYVSAGSLPVSYDDRAKAVVGLQAPLTQAPALKSEVLEQRIARQLNVLDSYLTTEKLTQKLEDANIYQISQFQAGLLDRLLALRGQPMQLIGVQEQTKLDQLLPKLLSEMQRRGLSATATERKVEFTLAPQP